MKTTTKDSSASRAHSAPIKPAPAPAKAEQSEAEALQALIEAHNAESKAIIEFIRAHNRAAIEAAKTRAAAKTAKK
jgi:hypothetical protein